MNFCKVIWMAPIHWLLQQLFPTEISQINSGNIFESFYSHLYLLYCCVSLVGLSYIFFKQYLWMHFNDFVEGRGEGFGNFFGGGGVGGGFRCFRDSNYKFYISTLVWLTERCITCLLFYTYIFSFWLFIAE